MRPSKKRPSSSNLRQVVGVHACLETLRVRPHCITQIFFKENFSVSDTLANLHQKAKAMRLNPQVVSPKRLERLSRSHQGVGLTVEETPTWQEGPTQATQRTVVILDRIQDPQNLGSMLRTAWILGVEALFIPQNKAVGLTASVCKVASGGAEHVPVVIGNIFETLRTLKKEGFAIYGLQADGPNIQNIALPPFTAFVVGSEGHGIRSINAKIL